jgi:hypothetical protein
MAFSGPVCGPYSRSKKASNQRDKVCSGGVSKANSKDTSMELSALLIATALSLTMLVAIADLP